jgi:uncharacterized protein involved in exopolysaccharide biosynthesis
LIQVAEVAVPPEKKSFPKRGLMVLLSAIVGFFISIFYVLAKKSFDTAQTNPEEHSRWQQLKAAWGLSAKRKGSQ